MRKTILSLLLLLAISMKSGAVLLPETLFVYGVSISFNDSVIYLTDIMQLDSAWINPSSKFIYSRPSYAYQMKTYLQDNQSVTNPTCVLCYAENRKDAEKKYVKLKSRLQKKNQEYLIKYIPITDFKFEAISAADEPDAVKPGSKAELKAAEKQAKKEAKEEKKRQQAMKAQERSGRPQGPPPGGGRGPDGGSGGGPGGRP